ncbi:hypothetical protein KIN20_015027 [Parelaphostrongylus tenuis]|uniref:Uncharacterized protein n=1 Tax=Parelaphostrongylus tenuis TaxID=148309 RepID=A0AAD5QS84_PARTN|nr:hypothetical protein KIN20_015027 [Parelaphostrongylus tenuis]
MTGEPVFEVLDDLIYNHSLQKLWNFVAASTRTFTASGPSNLPVIAVYTENKQISALYPGIATSKEAVQALAQRFAMQTVIDVLEIEGRRALLPDFVISNILSHLQVNTTYEPMLCPNFCHQKVTVGHQCWTCIQQISI